MTDLATMPWQELMRGLMRGNREELKLGYSPHNAVHAVKKLRPDEHEDELRGYAEGFSDGMNPDMVPMWSATDKDMPEHRAYDAGWQAGRLEDPELTYPSGEAI